MELVLISITLVLCTVLLLKLLFKLRSCLPWRVNCWFCNNNFWVKYPERNCWTCMKCDQYNGFTKDGDYNKPIINTNDPVLKTPKVFQKTPPKNGLCKMCNINQQLKIAQLANFVPMNENKFDDEIEVYRSRLEQAYKLCSPCRKVLQIKLHKEKETLLGSKLLEARTPEKQSHVHQDKLNKLLKKLINKVSMFIATTLCILVSIELYKKATEDKNLHSTIVSVIEIVSGLLDRIYSIVKMKTLLTFPFLENYYLNYDMNHLLEMLPKIFNDSIQVDNTMLQKAMGGFVCLIQIIANILNINSLKYTILIDLLWSVFVISISVKLNPMASSLIKILSASTLVLVYATMKSSAKSSPKLYMTSKRIKNISASSIAPFEEEDSAVLDTDDDVSLSKFGLHNLSESSGEATGLPPAGRRFAPRADVGWSKPKLNSTFCVNSLACKSPSSVSDVVFAKPRHSSFADYRRLARDDSDSELDESISSLCIGGPARCRKRGSSVFSLRKFAPTPRPPARPLISPSKLGHGTSWVAGGYWGAEGERAAPSADTSRSSSQSSGFESQASSAARTAASREPSVCGEPMVLDRPPSREPALPRREPAFTRREPAFPRREPVFPRAADPVFPQLQYNGYVHIPQARWARGGGGGGASALGCGPFVPAGAGGRGGSGLIRLPCVDAFAPR